TATRRRAGAWATGHRTRASVGGIRRAGQFDHGRVSPRRSTGGAAPGHLASVEDDSFDETLRVVWQVEVGARTHESSAPPSLEPDQRLDDPETLDAFLDAVRWGALTSADKSLLQAPFRSGIDIEDYQLDPLVRALGMPRANLLVVDEVHSCAPTGRGRYATDSLRTKAIRELAPHCEHRLFLSATPHNGYQESFTALLELLDDQRFARGVPPDAAQLRRVMVRRLKSELPPDFAGRPRFPRRVVVRLGVAYTDQER